MSVTATNPTLLTLSGTPVVLYPVPTPWPSRAGCDNYIYRDDEGFFSAWDPAYAYSLDNRASSCFPRQHSSWWLQNVGANPSTALGPTFACPEAYSAVYSTKLRGDGSAAHTQFTYCCPPNFRLNAIISPSDRMAVQCTSTAEVGATLRYQAIVTVSTPTTITGLNGIPVSMTSIQSTVYATSTVVQTPAATIYAAPVNGYNIVQSQAGDLVIGTATAIPLPHATSSESTTDTIETGLTLGAIVGAVVGGVAGVALLFLVIGLFCIRPRRRRRRRRRDQELVDSKNIPDKPELANDEAPQELEVPPWEIPGKELAHEMEQRVVVHELPSHV